MKQEKPIKVFSAHRCCIHIFFSHHLRHSVRILTTFKVNTVMVILPYFVTKKSKLSKKNSWEKSMFRFRYFIFRFILKIIVSQTIRSHVSGDDFNFHFLKCETIQLAQHQTHSPTHAHKIEGHIDTREKKKMFCLCMSKWNISGTNDGIIHKIRYFYMRII